MENRIKEIRESMGMTQSELADKSGVCRTVINQLENNRRDVIKSETMTKLSTALGKSVSYIFFSI